MGGYSRYQFVTIWARGRTVAYRHHLVADLLQIVADCCRCRGRYAEENLSLH